MLAIQVGLIGAGRMARALAQGFVRAELLPAEAILASDPSAAAREALAAAVAGARLFPENRPVASQADVVLLAVKPQQMSAVLDDIRPNLARGALVVSIAAGVTLARLSAGLAAGQRIVRVMPNTPCLIGRGASGYSLGSHATTADGQLVEQLFAAVGAAYPVAEELLDAVTGLSGSGPAFVYTMIESLSEGGVAEGLPPELAAELAARTVAGAAAMVLKTGQSPAALRQQVTSPGGTTLAGLAALNEAGFPDAVVAAVRAASRRSRELGQSST